MVKVTAQQAYAAEGSPRGGARYGFDEPIKHTMSDAERQKSVEHLQQIRVNHGALWGHRSEPCSAAERSKLEDSNQENRGRLGWLSVRSSMSVPGRKQLDNNDGRARLGWIDERDTGSSTARAAIASESAEGRNRLGWLEDRSSTTQQERTKAHATVSRRGAGLGFVLERDSIPNAQRERLHEGKLEERARLGFITDPTATNIDKRRNEAALRKNASEASVVSQLRLYADEPRTSISTETRSAIKALSEEGRSRLGMTMDRSPSSSALRARLSSEGKDGRARLGMLEERSYQSKADRAAMDATSGENYARLGMHDERDAPTPQFRKDAHQYTKKMLSRMGMSAESAREFSLSARQHGQEARREDRHRLGHESSRHTEKARLQSNGGILTPRKQYHSNSWHWGSYTAGPGGTLATSTRIRV